jgi:hypothetical protein
MADACVDTRNIASAATSSGSMYLPIGGIFGLVLDLAGSFSIGAGWRDHIDCYASRNAFRCPAAR